MRSDQQVKVWDPAVRVFHWVLVIAFIVAFATEDDMMLLHVWAGYIVGLAIAFRLLWGLIGTKYARFTDFVTSPRVAFAYAKDAILLRSSRYLGHNPAGGLMIIVMLVSLVVTTLTGIALYAAEESAGPMASTFIAGSKRWEDVFEGMHEFFANFTLLLVVVHVGGVIFESLIHRENLVMSMFNGYKRLEKP